MDGFGICPKLNKQRTQSDKKVFPEKKRFDTLMALPPQVQAQGTTHVVLPSYDRLFKLYVELLVEEGQHDQAFAIAEQINMRKVTGVLYDALGEEFFSQGPR